MQKITNDNDKNFYKVIKKHLKKQYPASNDKELGSLCREVVFAPKDYKAEINGTSLDINNVRENLADFIEQKTAENSFIPYSLDAEIADLIESTNCETSSMNEYYRWINVTAEIIQNSAQTHITEENISERNTFIAMSYARESEILLCLALYEAAGETHNKEKINILRFKLARLREMRSIVNNTPSRATRCARDCNTNCNEHLQKYLAYCQELQKQKINFGENINLNLKLNINHNVDDMAEDFSYLDHLRRIILYMMRKLEKDSRQNQRSAVRAEKRQKKKSVLNVPRADNEIER